MTFGPWVDASIGVGWPLYVSVAVAERSFQTTSGSAPSVAAFAVTTSVRTCGPAAVAAGMLPMVHVIEPGATEAEPPPWSGVASRNDADGGAAIVTETFDAAASIALVTKMRKG